MEILGLLSVPNWLLYLIIFLVTAYYYYTWNYSTWDKLGVPGPKPFPAIGNFADMMKHGFFDTDKVLVQKYGKIIGTYIGRDPLLVVADVELLRRIMLKDFPNFQDRIKMPLRGIMGKSLFDVRGEQWRHLRHLMTPAFSTGKLKQMMPLFRTCADRLVVKVMDKTKNQEEFDMKEYCGAFTMDAIASVAFGLDIDSQKKVDDPFLVNMRKLLDFTLMNPLMFVFVLTPFLVPVLDMLNLGDYVNKNSRFFVEVIKETLKQRRQGIGVRVDILQLLLDAEKHVDDVEEEDDAEMSKVTPKQKKSGGLTEEDISAQGLLFFLAGYDTTANTMSFLFYFLSTNQDVQDRVLAEIDDVMGDRETPTHEDLAKLPYLDMCINETLRLFPPVARVDRTPLNDFEYKGIKFPKGVPIAIPIRALHADPDAWPNPDKFDPERFTPEAKAARNSMYFMPFGLGPRMCIGMRLAQLEMKVTLVKVLRKIRVLPSSKTEVPIKLKKTFLTTPENGVWVKAELRS